MCDAVLRSSWLLPLLVVMIGAGWADRRGPISPTWQTAGWRYLRYHEGRGEPRPCYRPDELEPWVAQWHSEIDPRMGMSPAQAVTATLEQQLARLGLTRADLGSWRPEPSTRGRRRATATNTDQEA